MSKDIAEINNFLQYKLKKEKKQEIPVKTAAKWLDEYNYLSDSKSSPGFPLRRLMSNNLILGAFKKNNYYWYIQQIEDYRELMSINEFKRIIGVKNINSLYRRVKIKAIPHLRLNRNRLLFYKDELLDWLLKNSPDFELNYEKLKK